MLKHLTIPLWTVVLCLVPVLHTTRHVSAAELTYDATVEVSDNQSAFNVSVFPGKARYGNGTVSGVLGDGTVVDFRFFTADSDKVWSYADGGAGRIAPVTSPPPANVSGDVNGSQNWPDVWITSDPDTDPADFTTDTQAGAQNITGTINISGMGLGVLYFIHGTYYDPGTISLTMSGSGQPDILATHTEDPPNTVNKGWVSSFSFANAGDYDTIRYSYTNADIDGSRARFMGVILDGGDPVRAKSPSPEDETTDVPHDVVVGWTPGIHAGSHDVYFGSVFDDVNEADRANPLDVLVSRGQTETTFDPGPLEFGRTYYWRVDEVNAPPSSTIFRGMIWSFTTEPVAYAVASQSIKVTASSSMPEQGPLNTINGSGLANDLHSEKLPTMWLTAPNATGPAWVQYEFDRVLRLHEVRVWNHNGLMEAALGLGAKEVKIEYSTDGSDFKVLGTTHEFARAPGKAGYASNTVVDLEGIAARYVRFTILSNWGNVLKQYGLSEVRFFSVPVFAREPNPASARTGVDVSSSLSWRAGREAGKHALYLSTDQQAVTDGTAPAQTLAAPAYVPVLNLASTYYWRVDEVNEAMTPSVWPGDLWSLSTQEYLVVDDFESYTNDSPKRVFQAWIDGAGFSADDFFPQGNTGNGSGSLVGYDPTLGPIMETKAVHGGTKSMPMTYDNTTATYSETTRTFESPQNWALHGIKVLALWFYGDPNNTAQQMYVKINGTKVLYDGTAENLKLASWQVWQIDLTGLNVGSVRTLSIGFDRVNGTGGAGQVFIDDIRLSRPSTSGSTGISILVPNVDFKQLYKPGSDTIPADLCGTWTPGVALKVPMDSGTAT